MGQNWPQLRWQALGKVVAQLNNGVARIFVWGGGHPVPFSVISPGADRIQWGGGGGSSIHFPNYRITFSGGGGGVVAEIFPVTKSITLPPLRDIFGTCSPPVRITRRLWTLTEIRARFPGRLTQSKHVTASIHSRKKHLPKVWGGPWPPWPPPGYATATKSSIPFLYTNRK